MIHYLVTRDENRGITRYLAGRGKPLAGFLRILYLDDLHRFPSFPCGTFIFSNLDHLSPFQRDVAGQVARSLFRSGPGLKILNHPDRVLLRYELLCRLHALGINRFRAVRASESLDSLNYPVFLRAENHHLGALTNLLPDRASLERAIREKMILGYRRSELLAVELCDTSDGSGLFRKYSAFKIGNRIVPRYVNISSHWVVKFEAWSPEIAGEVLDYLENNPHESLLREIFDIAGADYGRIDYGMQDGRPQVWEINLNPLFGRGRLKSESGAAGKTDIMNRLEEAKNIIHVRLLEAFRELDDPDGSEREAVLDIPRKTLRTLKISLGKQTQSQFRAFMNMKRKPWSYVRRSLDGAAAAIVKAEALLKCRR
ncbi:MAG: hypothetical protein SCM96_03905 [Acidobacteriota bacterium]|nr:hypothetical protein [Acidobacteriota bacterium]